HRHARGDRRGGRGAARGKAARRAAAGHAQARGPTGVDAPERRGDERQRDRRDRWMERGQGEDSGLSRAPGAAPAGGASGTDAAGGAKIESEALVYISASPATPSRGSDRTR